MKYSQLCRINQIPIIIVYHILYCSVSTNIPVNIFILLFFGLLKLFFAPPPLILKWIRYPMVEKVQIRIQARSRIIET
jgi:hypothetical protein